MVRLSGRLSRRAKQAVQVGFDCIALPAAAWLALKLRIGFDYTLNGEQWLIVALAPFVAVPIFIRLGLYRAVLRYLPEQALWTILKAMFAATLLWTAAAFFLATYGGLGLPRSVPIIYWLIGGFLVAMSRFAIKWLLYTSPTFGVPKRTLIYGAGTAGAQLAAALKETGSTQVLAFVDDDPQYQRRDLGGLRVYPPSKLDGLINNYGADEAIICLPSASGARRLEIASSLAQYPITVRVSPSLADIAAGHYNVSRLRDYDIGELLGRSPVPPDLRLINSTIRGRRVLITGAGGSIGSQLARLVHTNQPRELFLLENNEYALYSIHRVLEEAGLKCPVHLCLASATDEDALAKLFGKHEIDVVYHAAAYKHVDLVEQNVVAAIHNNVCSTLLLCKLAAAHGVERFVLISSDKAVNPSCAMGATKRLSEIIIRQYADKAAETGEGQRFLLVRFGNVVGSSGSVVPLFKKQIEMGGPVTVTDQEVTRYFMAISEAAELIVQATGLSQGGETFLLDMGEPVSIQQLARDMIGLAGLRVKDAETPDGDIEIKFIGMRPGEKMHEELLYDPDAAIQTEHAKILQVERKRSSYAGLVTMIERLVDTLHTMSDSDARAELFRLTDESNRTVSDTPGLDQQKVIPLRN